MTTTLFSRDICLERASALLESSSRIIQASGDATTPVAKSDLFGRAADAATVAQGYLALAEALRPEPVPTGYVVTRR